MNNENTFPALSKTSLLKAKQCPKALYLTKNLSAIKIRPDPDQEAKFRQGLLDYCRLDTLAMVKILDELRKISGE